MGVRVGLLRGGRSAEREISLITGRQVAEALRRRGYHVEEYDTDRESLAKLLADPPACVFIALHGRWGEDGTVQGLLDVAGVSYTGSGVLASAIAMSKPHTKRLFDSEAIPTPLWMLADRSTSAGDVLADFPVPLVVKPAEEGSAIGVSIVREPAELPSALELAGRSGDGIVIEEYVTGVELTVAVLGDAAPEALPVIEIVPKSASRWYDFEAKYAPGMSEHVIPARIPEESLVRAAELGVSAHQALGCRDLSRVDMILGQDEALYVLEVNTIPGFTPTSLFPDAAAAAGIPFDELCERLVRMALDRASSDDAA